MNYPSRMIKKGEQDAVIVKLIQNRLNELRCGPLVEDGIFGKQTSDKVTQYQCWNSDMYGNPLEDDGKVGTQTWWSLFNDFHAPYYFASPLLCSVIVNALKEKGVSEVLPYSNRGPRVEEYLSSVRLGPGNPWCAAYVYWCFKKACDKSGQKNPLVRTGSCLNHWKRTIGQKITSKDAILNHLLIEPGFVFIINRGGGKGHTGIVTGIRDGYIDTIEGNTSKGLSSSGGSVLELKRRIDTINVGFINYK